MSARVGVKRLQVLIDTVWAVYPGGAVPQAVKMAYADFSVTGARLFTSETLMIDVTVRENVFKIDVNRRSTVLAWGREMYGIDQLAATALAFQRATLLLRLTEESK